jgi:hypothetical protein
MDSQTLMFAAAAGTLCVTMLIWQAHRFIRSMRVSPLSEDWLARRRCRPDFES